MNKLLSGIVILTVLINICTADVNVPDYNTPKTLGDYLTYASLNNAELKSKFEQWKASLEQIPQAKALPDPQFTYGKFIRQSDMQMNQFI
ncbi:MAG TPA: hypothetical protein DDX75_12780, partial [Phycisphaerales bacterium]|nr:hypothetical protein [Phycisphaerales bacterium]